jgi:hypothetical protein
MMREWLFRAVSNKQRVGADGRRLPTGARGEIAAAV